MLGQFAGDIFKRGGNEGNVRLFDERKCLCKIRSMLISPISLSVNNLLTFIGA